MSYNGINTRLARRPARLAVALACSCAVIWAALPESLRRMIAPGAAAANFVVSNTHDSGAGSLRAAILAANAAAGKDTIQFQLGQGPKSIKPLTQLPEITDPVDIDATTQPGYLGSPVVELDGSSAGLKSVGLHISAGGSTVKGLVINRFKGPAVLLTGAGQNTVQANYLGTDAAGTAAAGNAHGVWIEGGSGNNTVGGFNTQARNVISGNAGDGVRVEPTSPGNNKIRINYIGVGKDGTSAVPNGGAGVHLLSALNTVGGEGGALGDASLIGNVISGNGRGVLISGAAAKNNLVRGNTIGLDAGGSKALGNAVAGVEVSAPDNKVGGLYASDGNIISGNDADGLLLSGEACQNTLVQNNVIGPGSNNSSGVGNGGAGVRLADAPNNTIGGHFGHSGNLIAFNKGAGISIQGAKAAGNKVQGNRVGPLPGDAGAGNSGAGVEIVGAPNNTVGGTQDLQRNYIAGNIQHGVDIRAGSTGNVIQGNHFGMHECLCNILGNGPAGVRISNSSNNTVGGTVKGASNYITEGETGVVVEDGSTANTIAGNYIGFTPDGSYIRNAYGFGVRLLRSSGNTVGGTVEAARNFIGGFDRGGVRVEGPDAFGNKIQGNSIGSSANGGGPGATNGNGGVHILGAFDTLVGGTEPGAGNTIAGNGQAAIAVEAGTGNAILGNSIHSNDPKQIDLWPIFYHADDSLDADRGANERQNHPILKSAEQVDLSFKLKGSLDSAPNKKHRVEFFRNEKCGPHGQGGGQKFLGAALVGTGPDGHADFETTVPALGAGDYFTATATDGAGNTSEFSPCFAHNAPGVVQFTNFNFVAKETGGSVAVTVMRSAGSAGKVTVAYTTVDPSGNQQGEATPGADYTKTSGTLTFLDGQYLTTFHVPVTSDGLVNENDEVINLKLSNPTGGATLGQHDEAIIFLYNNNVSHPAVTVSDAVVSEGDSGVKQAALQIHVDPHTGPVAVAFRTQDGTAKAGEDYTARPEGPAQVVHFAPGETDKTILVDVHGDAKPEADEVFFVVFEVFGGYAFNDFGNHYRQVVITNDEAAPPSFSFDAPSVSTAENAGTATLNVTRDGSASAPASVNFVTSDLSAKAGADYAASSGTLHFAAGETSKAVTVQLTNDATHEALEEFEVKLSGPSAGATLGAQDTTKVQLVDDDPAPSFSVSDPSVTEGNAGQADAVFNVTLSAPSGVEAKVNYATADVLAANAAVAGEDYAPAQGQLTFAPGETAKQVVVKVFGDQEVEQNEVFALNLGNSVSATLAKPKGFCAVKNDDAAAAKPSATVSGVTVAEGDSGTIAALFTVALSSPAQQPLSFTYSTGEVQALNAAKAGHDFAHASGTLSFATGETTKTLAVQVNGDTDFEPDEAFILNLGAPADGSALVADALGQCVITNDDAAPTPTPTPEPTPELTPTPMPTPEPAADAFQFEQATYKAQEESAHVTLTVTRTGDLSAGASVDYETQAGAADDRGDFTTALGTLRFAPGESKKSFDVLLTEDSTPEAAEEAFGVTLSNPSPGYVLGALFAAEVAVTDDAAEPALNASDDAELFVRQHYHDFLGREADPAGLAFWTGGLLSCGADAACVETKRQHVSAAFFLSIEFQETGFLVHLLSRASYGAAPRYRDFVRDSRALGDGVVVGQDGWGQRLAQKRHAFVASWVARPEFKARYDALSNAQYVEALYGNLGLGPAPQEAQALAAALDSGAEGRDAVLLKVVSEPSCRQHEKDSAFVLMQYFGYLRRDPDAAPDADFSGYTYWLAKLNQFDGDFVGAEMVKAFISSIEYRRRFGL